MKNRINNKILMISILITMIISFILSSCGSSSETTGNEKNTPLPKTPEEIAKDARLQWFKDARFGMFIHWGIYSLPGGEWKGKTYPRFGEWIMKTALIPVKEYELIAKDFNPVKFNADEWVGIAKDAGMKYMVITAKHHDGFAMYHSASSDYNIVDATPFGRDPMKELAAACEKAGLRFCFYYSHDDEWHHPDGEGNTWDYPVEKKNWTRYYEEKVKPQVTELLTNYGPIYCMWFDNPSAISREQAQELADLVHRLQPNCLVNGRIGHGAGDYAIPTDNQLETNNSDQLWEATVTMNDTYAYKKDDNNWKPATTLIRQLVRCVSQNGNYLLNVGPTGEGLIPQPSVDRLRIVGNWMKVNGESIYSAKGSPFPYKLDWAMFTTRPGKIYVHVFEWPGEELKIYGIKSHVKRAYLLADPANSLKMKQKLDKKNNLYSVTLNVSAEAPDDVSVLVLEFDPDREIEIFKGLTQQPDGTTTLDPLLAKLSPVAAESSLSIDNRGYAINWIYSEDAINWDFSMFDKGEYELQVITAPADRRSTTFQEGRKILVDLNGKKVEFQLNNDGKWVDESNPVQTYFISKLGRVRIDNKGSQVLSMQLLNGQLNVPPQEAPQDPVGGRGPQRRGPSGTTLLKANLVPVE